MRIFSTILLLALLISTTTKAQQQAASEIKLNHFIQELMNKMTLEEKVGQMTQLAIEAVSEQPRNESGQLIIKDNKLKEAITKYHIGAFFESGGAANSISDWHKIITRIQNISTKETRLGIPILYGIDAIHGASYIPDATIFPQAITMAASRNLDLIQQTASITALEQKASGIPLNYNPVLGVGREMLWPRFWETYGEDTYLVSQCGEAYIKGLQGENIGAKDKVAACAKHFLGYSVPVSGFDRTPAIISEEEIREIYLPPFAKAVENNCEVVMINTAEINGIPTHANSFLINDLLKAELGFKGFTVSDWEGVKRLHTDHKLAATPKDAVRIAVMAGLDMSQVPLDFSFYNYLLELVKEGTVPMSRIDDAVFRILRVKYLMGLFDNPFPNKELLKEFATAASAKINLEAAREAITLLENKNSTLPLHENKKYLITGPNTNLLSVLNGGWTFTWQGTNESLYPKEKYTILEALQNKIGKDQVTYIETIDEDNNNNITKAVEAAKNVDAIILCLGEKAYCGFLGDITNLDLAKAQIDLAKALYKTGKPVILVLVEGRARVINEIVEDAAAIVMAYLPGMEGAQAIVDVLFGDVNPSGKLPFSYPKNNNGYTTYDYKNSANISTKNKEPQWPFGYGLSYTDFKYDNLQLNKKEITLADTLSISIDISNTGKLAGKEIVEVYISDLYASVTRPVKQLKRFRKIYLKANESKTIRFKLTHADLSFIGRAGKRIVEPGAFKIRIGDLEKEFVFLDSYRRSK